MTECDLCGNEFQAKTPDHRFCSDVCRKRAHRQGGATRPDSDGGENRARVDAIAERLAGAGDIDQALITAALTLATQIDADPRNAMLWTRFQASLKALSEAVVRRRDDDTRFEEFINRIRTSAARNQLDERLLGREVWVGQQADRFRPLVEAAVAELPDNSVIWQAMVDLGEFCARDHPTDPTKARLFVGSHFLAECDLADAPRILPFVEVSK